MCPTGPNPLNKQTRFSGRAGLTLLELVIVLAVLTVMLGFTLPRLTGANPASDLRTAGRRLAAAFNLARSQAVTTASPIDVVILDGGRTVSVDDAEKVIRKTKLPGEAKAASVRIRGGGRDQAMKLTFQPNGRTSEAAIYLTAGDSRMTLHLLPLTGRLEAKPGFVIYDWTG